MDLVLAHPTIYKLVNFSKDGWLTFVMNDELLQKLNKANQNTKLISFGMEIRKCDMPINVLLDFLKVHQWFSRFVLIFKGDPYQTIQVKRYNIKKKLLL